MPFRFRLEKVARYRRKIVDEKSRDVAAANRVVTGLTARLDELQAEIADARTRAIPVQGETVSLTQMSSRTTWTTHLEGMCGVVRDQLTQAREELETRREDLNRAWRDLEVLEKLRTRQQTAWRDEQHRREVQELDETGQIRADRQRRSKAAV